MGGKVRISNLTRCLLHGGPVLDCPAGSRGRFFQAVNSAAKSIACEHGPQVVGLLAQRALSWTCTRNRLTLISSGLCRAWNAQVRLASINCAVINHYLMQVTKFASTLS
jgi:hypothetical protein